MEPTSRTRCVTLEILSYLMKHPEAKDSLPGIKMWWLADPDKWSEQDVREAADILVGRGVMQIWKSSSSSLVFGLSEKYSQVPQDLLRELNLELGDQKSGRLPS